MCWLLAVLYVVYRLGMCWLLCCTYRLKVTYDIRFIGRACDVDSVPVTVISACLTRGHGQIDTLVTGCW